MNIIITLPLSLVTALANGRATVMITKFIPSHFYPDDDIVWVKTKGVDEVPLCLYIDHIEENCDSEAVWQRYKDELPNPYGFYREFVHNVKRVNVWHIKDMYSFIFKRFFSETFPNFQEPQTYIYTAKGFIPTKHRKVKKREAKEGAEDCRDLPPKMAVQ